MSEQDRYIREAQAEARRIVREGQAQWISVRHAAGHRDYLDKVAMRQVKTVVTRALDDGRGAGWRDVVAAVARVAAQPATRRGYVYALDDEITAVAQERRARERSAVETVDREQDRAMHDQRAVADWARLRLKHPGASVREILVAEGLAFGR